MHSFTTGTSKEAKYNNWQQISLFLKKHNIILPPSEYEPIVFAAQGAAVTFITKLYGILTKRVVKLPTPIQPTIEAEYMQPTASSLLKDTELTRIPDDNERVSKSIEVVNDHNLKSQQSRMENSTSLFRPNQIDNHATAPSTVRAPSATQSQLNSIVAGGEIPSVIAEVQVKAFGGKQVGILRQQRHAIMQQQQQQQLQGQESKSHIGSSADIMQRALSKPSLGEFADNLPPHTAGQNIGATNSTFGASFGGSTHAAGASNGGGGSVKPVIDILSAALRPLLLGKSTLVQALDPRLAPFSALMDVVSAHEDAATEAFNSLVNRVHLCADSICRSPSEFWRFWRVVLPPIESLSDGSPAFEALCNLVRAIGSAICSVDSGFACHLATDVIIPQVSSMLTERPGKRESLCKIIYGFSDENDINSRLTILRTAREIVRDTHTFVSVISTFVPLDINVVVQRKNNIQNNDSGKSSTKLDERLVDLFQYYGLVGLSAPQTQTRVCALAILRHLASVDGPHIEALLESVDLIGALASDSWWEVHAQLLLLASALLNHAAAHTGRLVNPDGSVSTRGKLMDTENVEALARAEVGSEELLGLIAKILGSTNSKLVIQVGLSALANNLRSYPVLLQLFVPALLQQPEDLRLRLIPLRSSRNQTNNVSNDKSSTVLKSINNENNSAFNAHHTGNEVLPSNLSTHNNILPPTAVKPFTLGASSQTYPEREISNDIPPGDFALEFSLLLQRHQALDLQRELLLAQERDGNQGAQTSSHGVNVLAVHAAANEGKFEIPQGWDVSQLETLDTILPAQIDESIIEIGVENANGLADAETRLNTILADYYKNKQGGNGMNNASSMPLRTREAEIGLWVQIFQKLMNILCIFLTDDKTYSLAKSIIDRFLMSPIEAISHSANSALVGGLVRTLKLTASGKSLLEGVNSTDALKNLENLLHEWLAEDPMVPEAQLQSLIQKALAELKETAPKEFATANLSSLLYVLRHNRMD